MALETQTPLGSIYRIGRQSDLYSRTGVPGGWERHAGCRRVPEDTRPQRHRLELLDRRIGAPWCGPRQRSAGEELAGRRRRCCPRARARRLQGFSQSLEGRRPRHPYIQSSQSRVREVAVAESRRAQSAERRRKGLNSEKSASVYECFPFIWPYNG